MEGLTNDGIKIWMCTKCRYPATGAGNLFFFGDGANKDASFPNPRTLI